MSDDLIRKRGGVKAKLSSFSKYLDALLSKSGTEIRDLDIIQLNNRVTKSEELIHEFEEIQSKIEVSCAEKDLDREYSEREEFESKFFDKISLAKKLLDEHKNENIEENDRVSRISPSSQLSNKLGLVKLPKITLPTFDGKSLEWLEFRDTYESLIHKNEELNEIQKFHYLRASLEGPPAEVVRSLEFSAKNYRTAWQCLTERYDNPRLLTDYHIKALLNIDQVKKDCSEDLRKMIDTLMKNLRALKQLEQPTDKWDILVVALASEKLDKSTKCEWEKYKTSKEDVQTLDNFKAFLKARAEYLESVEQNVSEKTFEKRKSNSTRGFLVTGENKNVPNCVVCKRQHYIQNCQEFLNLSISDRFEKIKSLKLCLNCLRGGHFSKLCRRSTCKKCHSKHHTLLHSESEESKSSLVSANPPSSSVDNNSPHVNTTPNVRVDANTNALSASGTGDSVLLSTAYVNVIDKNGKSNTVRALLDSGSQSSFITRELCQRLGLTTEKADIFVKGLNHTASNIEAKCKVAINSQCSAYSTTVWCFVLLEITGSLPNTRLDVSKIAIPPNIKLADPTFFEPGKVDLLLGADLFWNLICNGQIALGKNKPVLQKTRFGWIVSGPIGMNPTKSVVCHFSQNTEKEIQMQLTRFWELEECPKQKPLSKEEVACEAHFVENVERSNDGRFVVALPLKESLEKLGESYDQAERRFLALERNRFENDSKFKDLYTAFMAEYISLGHMKKVETNLLNSNICYYMPHHGVMRDDSLTTKLRVVFDASAPTTTGYSLNHLQLVGPTIQQDLFSILLRFRQHTFVVSADVEKMYRQVLIKSHQLPLQRILWRANVDEPLEKYELQTVTYGTTSASFLAIRCLIELAYENKELYPDLADIIQTDFYVDDMLTGAESIENAVYICNGISDILRKGCFNLRKFYSNNPAILSQIPGNENASKVVKFGENENAKTLGLSWCPASDHLMYCINAQSEKRISKRTILSSISQVFDPLGLLSPCIIMAKMLLQKVWLEKISWDEGLPLHLHTSWCRFQSELKLLNSLKINRHVICSNPKRIQLIGFSDASESAYGGCIFLRSIAENGHIFVNLLCAKTKVAPLKTITMPRLELCGALILARLANKVTTSLKLNIHERIFWTDSTIVLGWLKTEPNKLKTFVSNRVSEIQDLTASDAWRHVPTESNPADLLSRGVRPSEIENLKLWWHGPKWLSKPESEWPKSVFDNSDLPEMKKKERTFSFIQSTDVSLFARFSKLSTLNRVIAYVYRFVSNCRKSHKERVEGALTVPELELAFEFLIKLSQMESFPRELGNLQKNKHVLADSKIFNLNPFLDERSIIRVGGRLANSSFDFDKKHPIVLSGKHLFTKLLLESEHVRLLHCGPQQLLAVIRDRFWPVNGKALAKKIVRQCLSCFRHNAKTTKPIMGDLPAERLEPRQPFAVVGVDYAGPLLLKDKRGRGARISKAYISLFVCFVTKAIHLELVSDLTMEAFVMALRRFAARRGKPSIVFSDNGTNFVAASSELKALGEFLAENKNGLIGSFANETIDWRFIPPHSPHFGGLWEAGVKSTKHHLKRVAGKVPLTFECLYTLLVQVEAILNSRPLSPLSQNPNDLIPLTPAHFLIGKPLTSVPERDVKTIPENRLSLFQHIQQLKQHFWERWSKEFVSELQQRVKWKRTQSQLQENSLVLIKEDNQPPMQWKLGRVTQIHPGRDGIPRVASIRTAGGMVKRAFSKICPLPVNDFEPKLVQNPSQATSEL